MNRTDNILIRDPYLDTTSKTDAPQQRSFSNAGRQDAHRTHVQSFPDPHSKWKNQPQLRRELEQTREEFKRMARAYTDENRMNHKILDYQAANHEYHEALKLRNLDLNNKLTGLVADRHTITQQFQCQNMRAYQEKDLLIRKYESQADELLQAKRTISNLIDLKTRLQGEIQHLTFSLQTENDRFCLEMREQAIRMEGLERTIKNISETKDEEIGQLRNRIKIYENQNKRLSDQNRTLQITNASHASNLHVGRNNQNRNLDNLSQINFSDSNTKGLDQTFKKELQEQKQINQKLEREINEMKKRLFSSDERDPHHRNDRDSDPHDKAAGNHSDDNKHLKQGMVSSGVGMSNQEELQLSHSEGLIGSISTLRNGINKQVFEVFFKSVRDGEKHRSNSLVIFIQNWRTLDIERIEPYIESYFEARDGLKAIFLSHSVKGNQIYDRMQEVIPMHVGSRKGRSEINTWILSTIQFTKNQRVASRKTLNNLLLFLFRLLTIQYRITYPMQGKSYTIDTDVRNELHHEIVKAIKYIIQFK